MTKCHLCLHASYKNPYKWIVSVFKLNENHLPILDEFLTITAIKIEENFPAHIFASAVISYLSQKSRAEV